MAVMNRAAIWAKSEAAWKIMVFANSIDRAEHDGRMSGLWVLVRVVGWPSSEQTGMPVWAQSESKLPKPPMIATGVIKRVTENEYETLGTRQCKSGRPRKLRGGFTIACNKDRAQRGRLKGGNLRVRRAIQHSKASRKSDTGQRKWKK